MGFLVRHAAAGESVMKRISAATRLLASGGATVEQVQPPTARSPGRLATRLRLGQQVAEALAYAFARWDGKRLPAGVAKRDIPLPARLLHLVDVVVAHHCLGGWSERLPSLLLARATSNKQIAIGLGMAPETAGSHVQHIHTALGVSTCAAAALFAIQRGLAPDRQPLDLR